MEPNNFEKDFREKLNDRKIEPSNKAWDRLDAMLSVAEEKKPKRNFRWLYVAASILGFLLVGKLYFNPFESVKMTKDNPVVLEKNIDVETHKEPKINNEDSVHFQIQKKEIKNQTVAVYSNEPGNNQLKQPKDKKELSSVNHSIESNTAVSSSENNKESVAKNKYISAEELLVQVSDTKTEIKRTTYIIERNKKAVTVNPNELLLNAETELNQSYRESALDKFNKKLKAVKSAIANRNYEE